MAKVKQDKNIIKANVVSKGEPIKANIVQNEKTIKGSGTRRKRFYLHIKMVVRMGHENMAHIF